MPRPEARTAPPWLSQAPSLAEIFQSKKWSHALFTTYALSLSYFESEVLRPLLHGGCENIWLISDAEGYRASLLERRSMRVGQEYRLVPVALAKGVFHPKCIYLGSEDGEDLLLVGSGNVTFGGHGRNAEVFEVFGPQGASAAFADFADFLEAVATRPDIRLPETEWATVFADRARDAATRGFDAPGNAGRLVHSLAAPVLGQLATLLQPFGAVRRALVMSPYHDPRGDSIQRLVSVLKPDRTEVVVSAREGDTSPFPFAHSALWPQKVVPVRCAGDDGRFVHAKWYEFETPTHRVVLTGSINATSKALLTTDNVELGALRIMPVSEAGTQVDLIDIPGFQPQARLPSGLGEREIAYARFDRSKPGLLHGQIISLQDVAGSWDCRLVHPDGHQAQFTADVNAAGGFTHHDADLEAMAEMPALQIRLTKDEREARGWVHNDMYLSMGRRRRLTAGVMSRLLRREASDDDAEALLDYLALSAEKHAHLFLKGFRSAATEEGEARPERPVVHVNITDLAPVERASVGKDMSGLLGAASDDQFERVLRRFRRVLLGDGRPLAAGLNGQSTSGEAEDEEAGAGDGPPEDTAKRLGLERFEAAISQLAADATGRPDLARALLTMLFEIGMNMRLHRIRDTDLAYEFMRGWLFKACRMKLPVPDDVAALEQHVVTAVALCETLAAPGSGSATRRDYHDLLERFYGSSVDPQRAARALIVDPRVGFAQELFGTDEVPDLAEALSRVLARTTRRKQLADALSLVESGAPVPGDWEVFQGDLGQALLAAFRSEHWSRKIKRAYPKTAACAHDWNVFPHQETYQFENLRIGRCVNCKRFTLRLEP